MSRPAAAHRESGPTCRAISQDYSSKLRDFNGCPGDCGSARVIEGRGRCRSPRRARRVDEVLLGGFPGAVSATPATDQPIEGGCQWLSQTSCAGSRSGPRKQRSTLRPRGTWRRPSSSRTANDLAKTLGKMLSSFVKRPRQPGERSRTRGTTSRQAGTSTAPRSKRPSTTKIAEADLARAQRHADHAEADALLCDRLRVFGDRRSRLRGDQRAGRQEARRRAGGGDCGARLKRARSRSVRSEPPRSCRYLSERGPHGPRSGLRFTSRVGGWSIGRTRRSSRGESEKGLRTTDRGVAGNDLGRATSASAQAPEIMRRNELHRADRGGSASSPGSRPAYCGAWSRSSRTSLSCSRGRCPGTGHARCCAASSTTQLAAFDLIEEEVNGQQAGPTHQPARLDRVWPRSCTRSSRRARPGPAHHDAPRTATFEARRVAKRMSRRAARRRWRSPMNRLRRGDFV